MKPEVNKRGPFVFLPKGVWELSGNTKRFSVTTKSLISASDSEEQLVIGSDVLLLDNPSSVQVMFTGIDVEKASIYAVRKHGTKPSNT